MQPGIIELERFKERTNLGRGKSRKNLKPIDALLDTWQRRRPVTIDHRILHLMALIDTIDAWLTARVDRESDNLNVRRPQVEALRTQALKQLAYEQFEQKKEQARTRPVNPVGVGLRPGYSVERTQFIEQRTALRAARQYGINATISPIGGSYAHDVHSRKPLPHVHNAFDQFTTADYTAYVQANVDSMQSTHVHFMRKQERLDHMLTVADGLLLLQRAPYSTGSGITIFAMDLYGNLFVKRSNEEGRPVGDIRSQYNHSSLNAGNDVICAGEMVVENGVLRRISNGSGHYRPSTANLVECLDELARNGLNLAATMVVDHAGAGQPVSAAAFMQPNNVALWVAPVTAAPVTAPATAPARPGGFFGAQRLR